jgi:20S proteasome alpha/beta subunit
MTLAIAVKGTEGIVLAVDSRVTIQLVTPQVTPQGTTNLVLPATYDNATKLLKPSNQNFVGAVTYGNAVFDPGQPRTAHSFLSEFEATLGDARISVREFAIKLGQFYLARWNAAQQTGEPAHFIIGGYDEDEPYGRLYSVEIPGQPQPTELHVNSFGAQWGGQIAVANGLLGQSPIPYQLLPLQDCIDVAILAVRTTAELQKFVTDIRGVGGPIDVAVITKIEGFRYVQSKSLHGERGVGGY